MESPVVMAGLVPAIYAALPQRRVWYVTCGAKAEIHKVFPISWGACVRSMLPATWIAGASPAMTLARVSARRGCAAIWGPASAWPGTVDRGVPAIRAAGLCQAKSPPAQAAARIGVGAISRRKWTRRSPCGRARGRRRRRGNPPCRRSPGQRGPRWSRPIGSAPSLQGEAKDLPSSACAFFGVASARVCRR